MTAAVKGTDEGWPLYVRDAELQVVLATWKALEIVTGASLQLTRKSATDDGFLWLLGDWLHSFHTDVEHPDEYLVLQKGNASTALTLDIAAERVGILESLCQTTIDALLNEPHLLFNHPESRRHIADSLRRICDAAHTFDRLTQIFPRVPQQCREVRSTGCNRQYDTR